MGAPWAIGACTLKVTAAGSEEARRVNAGWLVVAVTVVGTEGTVKVETLVAAVIDNGGCSRWCSVEAGDRLLVLHMASWLVLAGGVAYCRN